MNRLLFRNGRAGSAVRVCLGDSTRVFAVATCTVRADGTWLATFARSTSGRTDTFLRKRRQRVLHYEDVMIGEVWIAAGQAIWSLSCATQTAPTPHLEHSASLRIRFYNVPKRGASIASSHDEQLLLVSLMRTRAEACVGCGVFLCRTHARERAERNDWHC